MDKVCQSLLKVNKVCYYSNVPAWLTWCKPIYITSPLFSLLDLFFVLLPLVLFFLLFFLCLPLCQRYRCVRDRRVCILRLSNAISLTTGFAVSCAYASDSLLSKSVEMKNMCFSLSSTSADKLICVFVCVRVYK